MDKTLYIMRGLPGSGKSTKAKELCHAALNMGADGVVICSTDSFFMRDGKYVFNPEALGYNHAQNQRRVDELMTQEVDVIIVDNTNITRKDMNPYTRMAEVHGYEVREIVIGAESMRVNQSAYVTACFERNTHGVPREAIERMAKRFEF